MFRFLKEYIKFAKEMKAKEKFNKKKAIDLTREEMQNIVNAAAENPGLWVEITYHNGDMIKIKQQKVDSYAGSFRSLIDGEPTEDEIKMGL